MEHAADAAARPVLTRTGAVVALLVLLLLLAAGYGVREWRSLRTDDRRQDAASAAGAAARAEVTTLISLSAGSSKDDLARLLAGATRSFRSDLQAQVRTFTAALKQGGVTATGEVTSSGVVEADADRARVLVAAEGTVTNDRTDGAEPRQYRVRVDLERVDDRWLVSRLEFVP